VTTIIIFAVIRHFKTSVSFMNELLIMKTSENITARKMSVYWLTLLLLNGINVYPGHGNRGNFLLFRFEDRRKKNNSILRQRKPTEQVTVDFSRIINTEWVLELVRACCFKLQDAGRGRICRFS